MISPIRDPGDADLATRWIEGYGWRLCEAYG